MFLMGEKNAEFSKIGNERSLLIFIFLAIILLPFNDLPYFKIFGELSGEGAFYPLLIGILIWLVFILCGQKPTIPKDPVSLLLGIFFLWVLISGIANYDSITTDMTKGRSGIEKYILQVMVLAFCLGVVLFIYNSLLSVNNYLEVIRFFILVSLVIAGIYSVIEIASLLGNDYAKNILGLIEPYIQNRPLYGRLRSVSGEASWFAMYCSFILPWIVSYIFTEEKKALYIFIASYLLVMMILTFSRTAYFIAILQVGIVFPLILFVKTDIAEKKKLYSLVLVIIIAMIAGGLLANHISAAKTKDVITSFANKDSSYAQSNVARLGAQMTAINMGKHSPVFGVGLGQYGFNMADYVPEWALDNYEMKRWLSSSADTAWAPVHSIYHRIFAELGLVGIFLWLSMWIWLLIKCCQRFFISTKKYGKPDYFGMALLSSLIGVLMAGLNSDTFRFMGYWFIVAMGLLYLTRGSDTNDG